MTLLIFTRFLKQTIQFIVLVYILSLMFISRNLIAQEYSYRTPIVDNSESPHTKLKSVNTTDITWQEGFWKNWYKLATGVTMPQLYTLMADPGYAHALENFKIAAGMKEGNFIGSNWQDEWVYKWIEMASVSYSASESQFVLKKINELVYIIDSAQAEDGYIATQTMTRNWERFQDPNHHEWYVMGHLLTAAVINHRMTGETRLLEVAKKTGDFAYKKFTDDGTAMAHFPLNPSLIMGAVELYRETKENRYLELAQLIVDSKGVYEGGIDLNQDRVPLREENEVVGHAPFFTYLYAGSADVIMETGDADLMKSLERLWQNLVDHKMSISGGISTRNRSTSMNDRIMTMSYNVNEATGIAYELPNAHCDNEICGQVGNFMWNYRMLQITGNPKYADIMELEMYNGFLSGISLDGKSFYDTTPLRFHGDEQSIFSNNSQLRQQPGKNGRVCCPTNLTRTLIELKNYFYSIGEGQIWIHQYGSNTYDNGDIRFTQKTNYPWDGLITITIDTISVEQEIKLRIPPWAGRADIMVNSIRMQQGEPGSYYVIKRNWKPGDEITVEFKMKPKLMVGNPKIESVKNQVAVMRGPILYCLEERDLPKYTNIEEILIPSQVKFNIKSGYKDFSTMKILSGMAFYKKQPDWNGKLYEDFKSGPINEFPIKLIPYFAWSNRGISKMTVWMPLIY